MPEGSGIDKEKFFKALIDTVNTQEIEKKQKGFLCMFSGGLDSTALLNSLLTNKDYEDYNVYVHHIRLKNRENRGDAEVQAVRRIVKHYHDRKDVRQFDYKETVYDASTMDEKWSPSFSYDMDVAAFIASQVCIAKPQIKFVGIGVTKDDYATADPMSLRRYDNCHKIFNAFLYRFPEQIPYPKLIFPLQNLTKEQLWKSIPSSIQQMTWSCRRPVWRNGEPHRCGICKTCKERKAYGIDS